MLWREFGMGTTKKRIIFSITNEQEKKLATLKRTGFYDVPFSELYRHIFDKGIKAMTPTTKPKRG